MNEKICSHCGAAVLTGLDYCPSCLRSVRTRDEAAVTVAPGAYGTRLERIRSKWSDFVTWFGASAARMPVEKDDPRFDYHKSSATTSMSEGYTRVVCPKCLHAHRAPLDQSPSATVVCTHCEHQFPASLAAEFRKGADLNCVHCGVTTFCVNGLKVNQCPNCKIHVKRRRDPERDKVILVARIAAALIVTGFAFAVATQTTPQFLLWLCIGTVFTFVGFITMVALGF